jgi:hypothetical protein
MASFQFGDKDRDWDGSFVTLPDGVYDFTVIEAGDGVDKDNNMEFQMRWRVDRQVDAAKGAELEHANKEIPHKLRFKTDGQRKRTMHFLNQCNLNAKAGQQVNVSESDVLGKRFRARVTQWVPEKADGSPGTPMPMISEEKALGEAEIRVP